jgi:hypothetical protein
VGAVCGQSTLVIQGFDSRDDLATLKLVSGETAEQWVVMSNDRAVLVEQDCRGNIVMEITHPKEEK